MSSVQAARRLYDDIAELRRRLPSAGIRDFEALAAGVMAQAEPAQRLVLVLQLRDAPYESEDALQACARFIDTKTLLQVLRSAQDPLAAYRATQAVFYSAYTHLRRDLLAVLLREEPWKGVAEDCLVDLSATDPRAASMTHLGADPAAILNRLERYPPAAWRDAAIVNWRQVSAGPGANVPRTPVETPELRA